MGATKTVLLVEDNKKLNVINRRALEGEGHKVLTALTLAEAQEHFAVNDPDVILLDVLLPDGDGIDFCREIRSATNAHILFLTSKTDQVDRIRGLDTGGDDYITKPYKLEEMLSRVRAAIRRRNMDAAKPSASIITRGSLVLNTLACQAFLHGEDMLLKPKEFALLRLLVENAGKRFTAEELYKTVWGASTNDDIRTVQVHISGLRKKLKADTRGAIDVELVQRKYYVLHISLT
jgi:DNA-binding response OmpR family regulator